MNIYKLSVCVNEILAQQPALEADVGEAFDPYLNVVDFAIVAESEERARTIAAAHEKGSWWLDPKQTSCDKVVIDGPERIVIANQPTG